MKAALAVTLAAGGLGGAFALGLLGGRAAAPPHTSPRPVTKMEVVRLAPVAALPPYRARVQTQPHTPAVIVG